MRFSFRTVIALLLLTVVSACSTVTPLPKATTEGVRRISVVSALSDKLVIQVIGKTIFNNSDHATTPPWSHNEIALTAIRPRVGKNYDLVEAVAVRASKPGESGVSPAEYAKANLKDPNVDLIIVLTESVMGDPFFLTTVSVEGIGLLHRDPLIGGDASAAFAAVKITILDGKTLKVLTSALGHITDVNNGSHFPPGTLLATPRKHDFMGLFIWKDRLEDYSPETLAVAEKGITVSIQASVLSTIKEMGIRIE